MMHHVNSDCNRPISLTLILTLSLSFVRQGYGVGVLSLSLFTSQVVDPRPGASFPDSAVEEALGSAEAGVFPPTLSLAGSVCLVGTQPSLYFSPRPGLIPGPRAH